jgi:SAM-dependent methyltransferase
MPKRLNLPDSASVATPGEDGRLFAPSAARNADAIVALVADNAPSTGKALELASGTGQHIVHLARAMPGLTWQPSEIDATRRASINGYLAEAALPNVAEALDLDATSPGWGSQNAGHSLILLVNLLHLISTAEARTLISEAAQALAPGGTLVIYGPFMRDDELTSDGDRTFHASLQAKDPEIGYKSDFDVVDWGRDAWLDFADMVEMPANNLAIIWRKPA